jgi:plasmid stabilization system protein ParE
VRVRYTRRAAADLEAIYDYIDERSPSAARAVKRFIKTRIEMLADYPFAAPAAGESDTRELSMSRYPYKVYYRVERGEVAIVHIRDARRRPWKGDADDD